MFSGRHYIPRDADGRYFIDRDGTYFGWAALRYLQDDSAGVCFWFSESSRSSFTPAYGETRSLAGSRARVCVCCCGHTLRRLHSGLGCGVSGCCGGVERPSGEWWDESVESDGKDNEPIIAPVLCVWAAPPSRISAEVKRTRLTICMKTHQPADKSQNVSRESSAKCALISGASE